jgi:hypothetical protein
LREKPTIQKLFAFLLLVCLTIGFIPQRYFHDAFADHKDTIACEHPSSQTVCIHQKGFQCGFSDLVVSTPYVSGLAGIAFIPPVHISYYNSSYQLLLLQPGCCGKESRGPPSSLVA